MTLTEKTNRLILSGTSGVGLLTAVYLTMAKLTNSREMCLEGIGDCWTVNNSMYSEFLGIPVALFGAAAYLSILGLLWLEGRNSFWSSNSPLMLFGITLFGVLISGYLTYIEVAVIHAVCPFCVLSAIAMVILFVINTIRLVKVSN
jgi:uncharacterized membrane protein